jgi:hypothetical protein
MLLQRHLAAPLPALFAPELQDKVSNRQSA